MPGTAFRTKASRYGREARRVRKEAEARRVHPGAGGWIPISEDMMRKRYPTDHHSDLLEKPSVKSKVRFGM